MEAAAAPAPAGAREERLAMQLASADLQAGAAATGGPVAAAPVAATDAGDQANTAAPASGGALGGPGLAPACLAAAGALLLVLL